MGHRLAVLIFFIWIAYITWHAVKEYKHQRVIYYGWIIAFTIVILQVIAGMLVVLTKLNLTVALLHSLFISMLFGLLCYMVMLVARSNYNEKQIIVEKIRHIFNGESFYYQTLLFSIICQKSTSLLFKIVIFIGR